MKIAKIVWAVLAAAILGATHLSGAEKQLLPADPDAAWKEVENAAKPPPFPEEWKDKAPTDEQKEDFQDMLARKSVSAAAMAREFHTRFPTHAKVGDAKEKERQFTQQAIRFGADEMPKELESALPEDERIAHKLNGLNRRALTKQPQGMPAVIKEFETGLRALLKEYPTNSILWGQLMVVAENTPDEKHSTQVLDEIVVSAADDEIKERARGLLRAKAALDRPLEIAFAAADGSAVDVQKMKGKVVLLDFWASWCGPCIASLPEVIKLYEDYHEKGLEILGINLDKDRKAMDGAIQKFRIPWKHYFDGKGWGNKYAIQYNVTGIPSMWLVDKRGILRTMNARENLEDKVKELLAESDKL